MSYRENYVENWEGKTGQQVSELIQTALGEHGAALNAINNDLDDKIEKIQFNTTKESGKVFYQYNVDSYDNSKEADGVFELKAVSNNHGQIILGNYEELYTNNTIIKYGTPFSFTVYYDILNANNQRLIGPATIKVSVNGKELNKQGLSFTTTRTGTSASKIVTLLPEELPEGTCEIRVDVDCTYGGATVFADDTPTFKINVLNPVLTVTFDDENGINKMRSMSDKFNLHFTVKNSKGQAILINNQPVVPTYDLYYGTSKTLTVSTPDNELSFNDIKGNGLSEIQGRQRIYIQAKIGQGSNIVTSNIVLLYMFCNNYISNSTLYATQLNNVQAVVSGDPTITVNQYDNTEFVVYAYSESAKQLAYTLTENNIQKTLSENYPLQADTIQDISYSIIFKSATNQSFRISDGAASDLGIQVLVNSIGTSLNELTSQVINLSANGKQSTDRIWSSNNYSVIFDSGFDWSGNGWINNGLLINNGATATIPYCPFSTGVFTASFRFFASNSISTEKLIECKSGNTEFSITPEKASFIINGSGISTEFDNSETREITFVRYAATYGNLIAIFVDGSMQCVKAVTDNASSVDANIIITASETELYLYNVNIFSQALSFTNVQSVFCFNKSNAADIIEYVKENNVFNAGASLTSIGNHGQDITPESLPAGSRYLLISAYKDESNGTSLDPTPWSTIDAYPGEEAEKYKGTGHLVGNILFIEKTADGSPSKRNFCVDKGTLCAQGTSSMAYPFKNFRLRFLKTIDPTCEYYNESADSTYWGDKAKAGDFGYSTIIYTNVAEDFLILTYGSHPNDYSYVAIGQGDRGKPKKVKYPLFSSKFKSGEEDSAEAKIFCLKADYAESSGSHNTGFARMAHDALTNSVNICPTIEINSILPQQYVVNSLGSSASYTKQIRSTIDGFPVYLFFKKPDGTIVYHGKYNFNNEKSSKDVFGFEKINDYFNNPIVKSESTLLKRLFNDTMGYYDATHFAYTIDDNGEFDDEGDNLPYINPTECWEFSNNTFDVEPSAQNVIGAFQYPYTVYKNHPTYSDGTATGYPNPNHYNNCNPFTVTDSEGKLAWLSEAWEYRYPGLDDDSAGDLYYKNGDCPPYLLDSLYRWLYKHNKNLGVDDNTINDFAENLHKYFNVNYLLKYFVLTKWFGNVDQRIKNCMISFYCDPTVESNEDTDCPMGHMRAFYIFYDNDTILGVDNAGTLTQPWDLDEDVYPGYGKHAIWDNLEYCYKQYVANNQNYLATYQLGELIQQAYQAVRTVISDEKLIKYFETDQVDKFPDAVHNVDAEVKYFYISEINNTVNNFDASSIAKFQGNRKYHRKRWLTKRTNWLDSKFRAGNYSKYSYKFKVGGTSGQSQEGGVLKLKSGIKDWRFYVLNTTGQTLASSSLLAVNGVANLTIPANSFSISDFVTIGALYGCIELDMTDFAVSTWFQDLSTGGKILPLMKKFTLNDSTNSAKPKKFSSAAFEKLLINTHDNISEAIFPNLEELNICHTILNESDSSSRLPKLTLTQFGKLKKIDATGTDVDIDLPNSGLLTNLVLQSPTTLTIANKPSLTSLSILDTSNLNTIVLGPGNNSLVYDNIFTIIDNRKNETGFTATITLGQSDNYYSISSTLIQMLLSFVGSENITVQGYVYNTDISPSDVDTLTTAYPNLIISSSISTGLSFNLSSNTLREGETLTVMLTSGILNSPSDWYYAIYDTTNSLWVSDSISTIVTEDSENKTRTKLILSAPTTGDNTSSTYRLRIGANYGGSLIIYENEITVQRIGITSYTISAENGILKENDQTLITIHCVPQTHTKSEWIANNITVVTHDNCNYSNGVLTMGSEQNDALLSLKIGSLDPAQLTIIYNKILTTWGVVNTASNDNHLRWIRELLFSKYGSSASTYSNITVSVLNDLTITLNDLSKLSYVYDDGNSSVIVDQDLTWLQYCKYSGTSFEIPSSLQFTDLVIPYNQYMTQVNWNPSIDQYQGYGKIVFPESLQKAIININSDTSKLPNLLLDFSKTKINKIYNGGGSCDNNAASISITHSAQLASETPSGNPIFIYPNITNFTLGNYTDNWSNQYNAIFNLTSTTLDTQQRYAPLYVISTPSNLRNLGIIYNYRLDIGLYAFSWTNSNLYNLYYTFPYNNMLTLDDTTALNTRAEFSNVIKVGNESFKNGEITNLVINSNVTNIGSGAFSSFTGNILSSATNQRDAAYQLFDHLSVIGDNAFLGLSEELDIEISGLTSIGTYAFARNNDSTFTHKIYLNQNTAFTYSATSFGQGNTVYMSETLLRALGKSADGLNNTSLWNALAANIIIETI